ncbi:nitrate/nitrite transporter NrtS [Hyphomicrobium sp. NDB2Meth4]|uniref:nitrate/nitrite transporter NrtS n=1 Tax=Hyphomicrobium sp. NDB2Meth4 TaxID=1892846 RepID=UPI0009301839|nr:nitrate/nitrite transporter NrtS [Hyphomicrobium sp. NDB2Meth4]
MHGRSTLRQVIYLATTDGVPRTSLSVALVVGSLLNLINQGDVLLGAKPVIWPKLVLTYLVPYGVSTYGAVAVRLRHERRHT